MASEVLEKGDKVKFRFDSIYAQIAPSEIGEVLYVRGEQVQVSFKQLGIKDIYSVHEFDKLKSSPTQEFAKGDVVCPTNGRKFTTSKGNFAFGTIKAKHIGPVVVSYDISFELHEIYDLTFRTSGPLELFHLQTEGSVKLKQWQTLPLNANDKEFEAFRKEWTNMVSSTDHSIIGRNGTVKKYEPFIIDHLDLLTPSDTSIRIKSAINSINNNPVNKKQDGQQGQSYNVPGKHFSVTRGEEPKGQAFSSKESEAKFAVGHFSYGGEAFRS